MKQSETENPHGILIDGAKREIDAFHAHLEHLGLSGHVLVSAGLRNAGTNFRLAGAQDADALSIRARFGLDSQNDPADLEREILLAMMMSPTPFRYGNHAELASAVRIRKNIVAAAHRTTLAFETSDAAERPTDYWTYTEEHGFTVLPGKPLVEALRQATQPDVSGSLYDFSCYRATEYVFLLGFAEELATCNPNLLARLQKQWETRAIISRAFHEVFLIEYGSMESPLPPRFYVPGDRLWFRNPDERSSDVTGYEGSWVFYLGSGLFTNFWKRGQTYTMTDKCLEIYHWRHGVREAPDGELRMDETEVEARVAASLANPGEVAEILQRMMRWRDPRGVYAEGGCIDTSREYARAICNCDCRLELPDA